MKSKLVISALVVASCTSFGALADDRDAENTARMERALAQRIALSDDSVRVVTVDGRMELVGTVESYHDAGIAMVGAADLMVADNNGLKVIRNSLTILEPFSPPPPAGY